MIVGYMLLDNGGRILVSHMYEDVLGDRDSLFASAISAISNLFGEAIGEQIRYIKTKNYHLYIGFLEKMVLIVVSTIEDPKVSSLVQRALDSIASLDYDADDITFSTDVQDHVDDVISDILNRTVLSISVIADIARQIIAFIKSDDHEKAGISLVRPKSLDNIPTIKLRPLIGDVSIEDLIKAFLIRDYDFVIANAPKKFLDTDLAKILYAKACLRVLAIDKNNKINLHYLYNVIMSVEDEIARSVLLVELKSFFELGGFSEQYRLFDRFKDDIIATLATGNRNHRQVYLILFYPLPLGEILDLMVSEFDNNEDILATLAELKALYEVLSSKPDSFDHWSKLYGTLKHKIDTSESDTARMRYYHAMQYVNIWGLLLDDINLDIGRDLLLKSLQMAEHDFRDINRKKISNSLKAANYYATYVIGLSLLLDSLSPEDRIVYCRKYISKIQDIIKWLNSVAKANSIRVDVYYVTLAGLLSILTKISYILGTLKAFLNLIIELSVDKLEKLWAGKDYLYALLYMDMLVTLGYIATKIDVAMARRKILIEIARNIEKMMEKSAHIPLIKALTTINAIRFYTLANHKKAETLHENVNEFGQFFSGLANIIRGVEKARNIQRQKTTVEKIMDFLG